MKFKVITTATCTKCKVMLRIIADQGKLDSFDFVDASSTEGRELCSKYKVRSAGIIIDTANNSVIELNDAIARLES